MAQDNTAADTKTIGPERYAQLGVLIVEDTQYMANLLRGILSGLGVRNITSVRSGEEALSALMRGKVDLAIMDDLEPPLDGLPSCAPFGPPTKANSALFRSSM